MTAARRPNARRPGGPTPPTSAARHSALADGRSGQTTARASLDPVDLRILDELQADARLTNVELAARVGLSPSPCLARVRAMEASGVVRGYVTLVDAAAVGRGVNAFVEVTLQTPNERQMAAFETRMRDMPEVLECYRMSGDAHYRLRVVVRDVAAFEPFLAGIVAATPGIAALRSTFALRQVKYETALPLPEQRTTAARSPGAMAGRLADKRASSA